MSRLLYDSTNAFDIPASAKMVAGYISGSYKWPKSYWDRFPNAIKITIATQV